MAARPVSMRLVMPAWPASLTAWLCAAAVCVTALGMAWWTWGTWPDVLVDFGRELYAPWQLSQGQVLYRDLAWLNGPLSPYVNAFWFQLFGVGLRSIVIGNLLLVAALIWLIFRLVSRVGSQLSATLAALTFVLMFGFSVTNYNYLSPYSHELTHGGVLAFACLTSFAAYLESGSRRAIVSTGLTLGLVFLTKAEVFLALAAALTIGLTAAAWTDVVPNAGRRGRVLAGLIGAALAPCVLAWALFVTALPVGDAWVATAGAWHYVLGKGLASLVFYQRILGLDDLVGSVRAIVLSAGVYAGLFGAGVYASSLAARKHADRTLWVAFSFAGAVVLLSVATRFLPWTEAARPLPFILLVFAGFIVRGMQRRRSRRVMNDQAGVLRLTFVVFAVVLLARMLLNTSFYRYGFVLALPATIVLLVAVIDWIPSRLSLLGLQGGVFRAVGLAGWLVLMLVHLGGASAYLALKNQPIGSGPDRFLADARATAVDAALREIGHRLTPDQTLLVLPEGVMLNYLARRASPTPYVSFMPVELSVFGESQMVAALMRRPPDYVALVHKDTSEYGVRFFGRDYGQSVQQWITSRYQLVQTWGDQPLQGEGFGISLLARAGGQSAR